MPPCLPRSKANVGNGQNLTFYLHILSLGFFGKPLAKLAVDINGSESVVHQEHRGAIVLQEREHEVLLDVTCDRRGPIPSFRPVGLTEAV
ncbi:hypothetical protein D3C86_996380 [compost metagenome]